MINKERRVQIASVVLTNLAKTGAAGFLGAVLLTSANNFCATTIAAELDLPRNNVCAESHFFDSMYTGYLLGVVYIASTDTFIELRN